MGQKFKLEKEIKKCTLIEEVPGSMKYEETKTKENSNKRKWELKESKGLLGIYGPKKRRLR